MKKILIVDDNADFREIVRRNLGLKGYEVLEAEDAKEGIALASGRKPDLILMDIRLPSKKRGIGAAKLIRKDDRTRDIPIIFVTGYLEGEEAGEVKSIPLCGYLTKPFETSALIAKIEEYLR
jgi:CheY-like chemotaxis protein